MPNFEHKEIFWIGKSDGGTGKPDALASAMIYILSVQCVVNEWSMCISEVITLFRNAHYCSLNDIQSKYSQPQFKRNIVA